MSTQMHVISGFVGNTPETREVETSRGKQSVTTLSLAVNQRNRDAEPTWYRVTMWNGLGLAVQQYVDKSDYLIVTGSRLSVSTWTNEQGEPMGTLEITADSVDFAMNRRNGERTNDEAPENPDDMPF